MSFEGGWRWFWGGVALAALAVFVINALALQAGLGSRDAVDEVRRLQEISTCRVAIAGAYNELRDIKNDIADDLQQQLDRALIDAQAGVRTAPEAVALYVNTDKALTKARGDVRALPPIDKAYQFGVTVNGVRYSACG